MRTLMIAAALLLVSTAECLAQTAPEGAVTRGDVQIHYSIVGDSGPYMMILSGGPGEEISSMQAVADHFRAKYRCIMLEQRGTGRSKLAAYDPATINLRAYIEDIEALRRHLGGGKIILVGNSWGMMLALAYAGAHPDSAEAVVTIGSGPITREYLDVFVANQQMRLSPADREAIEYWSDPARHAANFERAEFERIRATAPAYFYDHKLAFQYAMELSPSEFNPRVPPAFLKAEGSFDLRPLLRAITAPVLLLQGRQDLAGEANVYEAHLLIKRSVLKFINRCGHMPWLEQPRETWAITDAFLSQSP
jgi:proline iminopeptidase